MSRKNMRTLFERAVVDAIPLLANLPRQRSSVALARAQVNSFRRSRKSIQIDLLVDQPHGSARVDYDLFLGHPDGGTVALCYRADEGRPWTVEYADHWAANLVVTVNNESVGLPTAFRLLKRAAAQFPDLMEELVNHVLIAQAIRENPPPVNNKEVQLMADSFRRENGLLTPEATERWLREQSISENGFFEMMKWEAQVQKLQKSVAKEQIKKTVGSEILRVFRVDVSSLSTAKRIVRLARKKGLLTAVQEMSSNTAEITGRLFSTRTDEVADNLATARAGALFGPISESGVYWVAQVLRREQQRMTGSMAHQLEEKLFSRWLAARRNKAQVRWHWMEEAVTPV